MRRILISACGAGTLVAASFGSTSLLGAERYFWLCLTALLGVLGAGVLLRRLPRSAAFLCALCGAALCAFVSLRIHAQLRGERRDTGPDPTRRRTDRRVAASREVWLLKSGPHSLLFRATGPDPSVTLKPEANGTKVLIRNRTETAPASEGPLRVLVWGDCRSGRTVFDRLCAEIARRKPDFSLGLGDLVGMARTYQFALVDRHLEKTGVACFVVPGNHDLSPFGTLRPYARVFGPACWSFASHGWLFLGLDTADGHVRPADVDWMEKTLSGATPGRVVLACHHPPFAPEGHPEKTLPDEPPTRKLRALIDRYKILVLASHLHDYDEETRDGVVQIVTGGGGARPEGTTAYHYVWLQLGKDGAHFEKIPLMKQSDVSPTLDRFYVAVDEASYAARDFYLAVTAAWLGLFLLLGGAVTLPFRRAAQAQA